MAVFKLHRIFLLILAMMLGCGSVIVHASTENKSSPVTTSQKAAVPAQHCDSDTSSTAIENNVVIEDNAPPPPEEVKIPQCDPLERINRPIFAFNEILDCYILKPVAELYIKIMPKPFNKMVTNFYNNLDTVPTVINDVLQANFYQATSDLWRLGINSTIGIGGLFDVACQIGLEPNVEDFGLTLAHWGYKNSCYFVIPFMGPSTVRDTIAWPINYRFMTVYPYIRPNSLSNSLFFLGVVNRRADLLRFQSVFEEAAVDRYVFIRDAYLQRRNYQIQRNTELGNPYCNNHQASCCNGENGSNTDDNSNDKVLTVHAKADNDKDKVLKNKQLAAK